MIKFGTGGWRAIIADEFTKENIRLLTAGLCGLMIEEGHAGKEICVGYDRRFLSKESAHWAAEVLVGYGFRVYMINRSSPTPLMMFVVKTHNMPYGMAVTASHNPAIYNGIKVFTAGGRDADKTVTNKIEEHIARLTPEAVKSVDYDTALAEGKITEKNPSNDYIDSILAAIDVEAIKKAQLRIALDPMYGVSQTCLSMILMTCRCDLEIIHERHDTLFGGKLPAPNEETMGPLSALVLDRYRCDLGIATDGDADRLGVIDDEGHFVHPNKLLVLLYYYLVKYRGWTGPCVRNNSTTHLLDRVAEGLGQKCYEVPVGFKWFVPGLMDGSVGFGGEESAGASFLRHDGTVWSTDKDGLIMDLLAAEIIAVTGKTPSQRYAELADKFGAPAYARTDADADREQKAILKKLSPEQVTAETLAGEPITAKLTEAPGNGAVIGGLKVTTENAWFAARPSGTEDKYKIYAESFKGTDHLKQVQAEAQDVVSQVLGS